MKLKRIHLENFQCIGEATTIEVAPLTLLFGANSVGKSAIADVLELLSQMLLKTADPHMVRRWMKDGAEMMKIGLGYEIENRGIDDFVKRAGLGSLIRKDPTGYLEFETDYGYSTAYYLFESAQKKSKKKGEKQEYIELSRTTNVDIIFCFNRHTYVSENIRMTEVSFVINGEELASIKDEGRYVDIALGHHKNDESKWRFSEVIDQIKHEIKFFVEDFKGDIHKLFIEQSPSNIRFKYLFDPFDGFGLRDGFARDARGSRLDMYVRDIDYGMGEDYERPMGDDPLQTAYLGDSLSTAQVKCIDQLRWIFHGLIVLPARLAGALSASLVRVGPLRDIPSVSDLTWEESRNRKWRDNFFNDSFIEEEYKQDFRVLRPIESWRDGKVAWTYLAFNRTSRDEVNEMLSEKGGLGLNYEISCQRFSLIPSPESGRRYDLDSNENIDFEYPEPLGSPDGALTQGALLLSVHVRDSSRNLPLRIEDVGSGISQVVPVLAVLAKDQLVSFIEQPELHLHPKAQSRMGDLLLQHAVKNDRDKHYPVSFVETHSEHLALRVLRRLREAGNASNSDPLNEKVVFYYFKKKGGDTSVHRIQVDSSGRFVDSWPDGFFEDRLEDLFA